MTLSPLATARLKAYLTPLQWIRYEMAEDKDAFVSEFCKTKLELDSADVRHVVKNIIRHLLKLYDTDTIYKGEGFNRYIKMKKHNHITLVH